MARAADLAQVAPKYLGVPYADLDCQAFVERCLRDIGIIKNLPGSNAWFREMTWVGTPEECKKAFGCIPVGAFLFILKADGGEPEKYRPDGIGNASHIGIYTGMTGAEMCDIAIADGNGGADRYNYGDGAIHSSSSRSCVATSSFHGKVIKGGWNRVGLWDKLTYEGMTPDKPDSSEPEGGERMTAVVNVPAGQTVKMRAKPSTACGTYWDIPGGTEVVVESNSGDWSAIVVDGRKGYMMSKFLTPQEGQESGSESQLEEIFKELKEAVKTAKEAALRAFEPIEEILRNIK